MVLGTFSIQELNWTQIYNTTFAIFLWDLTLNPAEPALSLLIVLQDLVKLILAEIRPKS